VNYKKGCIRLAVASDTVYQLLAHSRGFSLDIPASSTTKTGRHDIAELLLKVALSTNNQIICDLNWEWAKVYLIKNSWKPFCVVSFNMDWWILVFHPER
jgi:hypothetical protein